MFELLGSRTLVENCTCDSCHAKIACKGNKESWELCRTVGRSTRVNHYLPICSALGILHFFFVNMFFLQLVVVCVCVCVCVCVLYNCTVMVQ